MIGGRAFLNRAAAAAFVLAIGISNAGAQLVEEDEGIVPGPALPGTANIVIKVRDRTITRTYRTNCAPESRPIGRWRLFPRSAVGHIMLTFKEDLTEKSIATYDLGGGEIRGKYAAGRLTGTWSHKPVFAAKCRVPSAAGKLHWGAAGMAFNSQFNIFSGTWNYCGVAATDRSWVGVRDCPAKPFEDAQRSFEHYATLYAQERKVSGGKDVTRYQDRHVAVYGIVYTDWICGKKGLRPKNARKPVDIRRRYRIEVTGPYTTPIRHIAAGGARRISAWEFEVQAEMFAAESHARPPLDFWNVPKDMLDLAAKKGLDLLMGLSKKALNSKKFFDETTDNRHSRWRHIVRVRCRKTANKRFEIYLDRIGSFPEVTSKDNLTWRPGAHGGHKENPERLPFGK